MDFTVFAADIKCAVCGCKDSLSVRLEKNQASATVEWECPDCHAKRTLLVKKSDREEPKNFSNDKSVKNYKYVNGNPVEIDGNGNPIEPKFVGFPTKGKKDESIPYDQLGRME